jgi:hypothetical protein
VLQRSTFFIGDSLDEFLVAEYPDAILSSLIKLSIGLEIFIKEKLEKEYPSIIHSKASHDTVKKAIASAKSSFQKRKEQRADIIRSINPASPRTGGRTIDFATAIDLFPWFYRFPKPKTIIKDLHDLQKYRNGLFHWKADTKETYVLSKQSIRLYEWFFTFSLKQSGGNFSPEYLQVDPQCTKRGLLKQLEKLPKNEWALNLQRRIFKHEREYHIYSIFEYRTREQISEYPNSKLSNNLCPACKYSPMEIIRHNDPVNGRENNFRFVSKCRRCEFHFSDKELRHYNPNVNQTLGELYDSL